MDKPGYFAIIPAEVRYDEELSSTAKLLYAEITALSNKYGFCTAKNKYFAELYDVSSRQIKSIMADLKSKQYITVYTEGNKRKIFCNQRVKKTSLLGEENFTEGVKKTSPSNINNTSINNIYNNIYSSEQSSEPAVATILLNDGSEYLITKEYADKMAELYPNVDVYAEFKKMTAWALNNPRRRKTKSGIGRFINSWLCKEQDKPAIQKESYSKQSNDLPPYYEEFEG